MVTYNTVVGDIKEFFGRHLQVKQFLNISTWDEQTLENVYVTVILVPQQSTINDSQLNLNFNLFIADILNFDGSNQKDVYSDTLEIARDFVAYFSDNGCVGWNIEPNPTITPFNERPFDDILSGWILNFTVQLPFNRDVCNIPFE